VAEKHNLREQAAQENNARLKMLKKVRDAKIFEK